MSVVYTCSSQVSYRSNYFSYHNRLCRIKFTQVDFARHLKVNCVSRTYTVNNSSRSYTNIIEIYQKASHRKLPTLNSLITSSQLSQLQNVAAVYFNYSNTLICLLLRILQPGFVVVYPRPTPVTPLTSQSFLGRWAGDISCWIAVSYCTY